MLTIRPANLSDAQAIQTIYAPFEQRSQFSPSMIAGEMGPH